MTNGVAAERPSAGDWMATGVPTGMVALLAAAVAASEGPGPARDALVRGVVSLAGIALLSAAPLLVASATTRFRGARWLALAGLLVAADWMLSPFPALGPFRGLDWNWQGKCLAVAACLGFVAASPTLTFREVGLTSRLKTGWWKPLAAYAAFAAVLWGAAFGFRAPRMDRQMFWFEATMPGLAEELFVRGLLLALLTRAFGQWRVGRHMSWGWPAVVTCLLFAIAHIVEVTPDLRLSFRWTRWFSGVWGFVYWWMRERTGSVWPAVAIHNLNNLQLMASYGA